MTLFVFLAELLELLFGATRRLGRGLFAGTATRTTNGENVKDNSYVGETKHFEKLSLLSISGQCRKWQITYFKMVYLEVFDEFHWNWLFILDVVMRMNAPTTVEILLPIPNWGLASTGWIFFLSKMVWERSWLKMQKRKEWQKERAFGFGKVNNYWGQDLTTVRWSHRRPRGGWYVEDSADRNKEVFNRLLNSQIKFRLSKQMKIKYCTYLT